MIYRDKNVWKLCPKKVRYQRDGETFEEYTNEPIWYTNFAKMWDNFEVIEIVDAEFSQAQKDRLEKVKHMSEGHSKAVKQYIETGEFPEGMDLANLLRIGKIKSNIIPSESVSYTHLTLPTILLV